MKADDYNGYKLELESDEINMLVALLGYLSATPATTDLGRFMEDLYLELEGRSDHAEVSRYETEIAVLTEAGEHSYFVILTKNGNGEYK
ncbi:hypothetical protein PT07_00037 [Pseudomonas phage PT07]|nr:hypothetical protein PT07_00037 [Pseudomonas phage PT07]